MKNKRLDDITERVQRLERKHEQMETALVALTRGLAEWMTGINDAMDAINERTQTMVADVAELGQHIRGKMDI